jgi:hypothetical protein
MGVGDGVANFSCICRPRVGWKLVWRTHGSFYLLLGAVEL